MKNKSKIFQKRKPKPFIYEVPEYPEIEREEIRYICPNCRLVFDTVLHPPQNMGIDEETSLPKNPYYHKCI